MKLRSSTHTGRVPTALGTIWTCLAIILLVLSMLSSAISLAAAQEGTPTDQDGQTEQPVDTGEQPTDVPAEQPTDTPPDQQLAPQQVLPASITVNYKACPPDADLANSDGATLNAACTASGPAATFALSDANGTLGSQDAAGAPATLTFPDLAPGTLTLAQTPAPAAFAVFCEGNTSHGNTKPYARMALSLPQATLDVLEDETITCDWFVATQATGGSLTLYKWVCPPNVDPAVDTSECATEMLGVDFTLVDGNGTTPFQSEANGHQLDGIVPDANGVFTIAEQIPPGYLAPVVSCQNNAEDPQPNAPSPVTVTNGSITIQPTTPSFEYQCFWYNVPDPSPTDITIRKWTCPPGYDVTASGADPKTDCTQPVNGITFVLSDTDPATADIQTATGDSVSGAVVFGGTTPGEVTITEQVPNGMTGVFLWQCDGMAGGSLPSGPINTGPAWELLVPGGLTITCDWYNVPSNEPGTVTLYKWQCPDGTDATQQDPSYYSAQCATEHLGIDFTLTDGNGTTPFQSEANGHQLDGVIPDANGVFTLTETIPAGYGMPVVFCQNNGEDPQPSAPTLVASAGGVVIITPSTHPFEYQCFWYNIPTTPGTVTIYKWECPQGQAIDDTLADHQSACAQPMNGVTFTLADSAGPRPMTTSGGMVQWTDVQVGVFTVTEEVPAGYSIRPWVACDFGVPSPTPQYTMVNNVLTGALSQGGQSVTCYWFNQYLGPADVTVYKWTCPEGYDWTAWGADPKNDCTETTNGVTFVLDQPVGVDLQTNTGDSIDGAVYFGGLEPGDYTVNEIVPAGISDVFVLDCVGLNTGSVHPVPLSVGSKLPMKIAAGDKIRCDWYNVPQTNPQYGWLTVTNYVCSTATYVSDIDCEIFEGGRGFDLQAWNGSAWVQVATGTTNTAGQVTWSNLMPGTYRVVEQGTTACHATADPADGNGNPVVKANAGTAVKVYNCGVTPPPGGKMPTKYPNTGVDPAASTRVAPGASILAALGLAGTATMSRRTFLRRSLIAGAVLGSGTVAVRAGQAIQPIGTTVIGPEGTPSGTPAADCLYPATLAAATAIAGTPVACARGAVPVHIGIGMIGVDAKIEVLEIIGGEMQQPTGATDVAWYKETARLGERGNILLAGHLNFWGVPEGVFFALGRLREGDVVELRGDDDETYRYIVQWTKAFPSDEEPPEEALGQTAEQAVTMITCGGEWVTDRSEYDHRTLVRAIRDSEYVPPSTPVATPGA